VDLQSQNTFNQTTKLVNKMNWKEAFIGERTDFVRFGTEHWVWIIFYGILFTATWIFYAQKQENDKQQRLGLYHGLFGIFSWIITTIVVFNVRGWYLSSLLPFHICYFLNLVLPIMHYKRSETIFNICYFWVMAACLQALITPDLDQSFPHYYNVRYFIVHFGLVQSILFAIIVYGFRPKPIWILGALLVGDLYIGIVHLINLLIGTNFVYTISKPPKTILDLLGDNYIIQAQPVALLLFALVYLPFGISLFIKKWNKKWKINQ
jgi:hypothetical integral membrane protein (TIGR02206 family)